MPSSAALLNKQSIVVLDMRRCKLLRSDYVAQCPGVFVARNFMWLVCLPCFFIFHHGVIYLHPISCPPLIRGLRSVACPDDTIVFIICSYRVKDGFAWLDRNIFCFGTGIRGHFWCKILPSAVAPGSRADASVKDSYEATRTSSKYHCGPFHSVL